LGIVVAELLQVRRLSCRSTNSIKALKGDSVPDWGQHAAVIGQEHYDVEWAALPSGFRGASLMLQ